MRSKKLRSWLFVGFLLAVLSWSGFFLTPTGSIPPSTIGESVPMPSPGAQFLQDIQKKDTLSSGSLIVITLLVGALYFNLRSMNGNPSNTNPDPLLTGLGREELTGALFWLFGAVGLSAFTSSVLTHTTVSKFYFFLISTLSLQLTLVLGGVLLVATRKSMIVTSNAFQYIRDIFHGGKLYLRVYPVILLTVIVNRIIQNYLPVNEDVPPSLQFFESVSSTLEMSLLIVMVGLIAPFAEELFFRGIIYENLKCWVTVNHAALISGGIFALVHFQPSTVFPLWVLGIIFALVYERTRSMTVIVSMHSLQNLLSLAIISTF